jgi:hypothetical protein
VEDAKVLGIPTIFHKIKISTNFHAKTLAIAIRPMRHPPRSESPSCWPPSFIFDDIFILILNLIYAGVGLTWSSLLTSYHFLFLKASLAYV